MISIAFFRIFSHHNFAKKQNFLGEHIKILPGTLEIKKMGLKFHKFSCRTHLYLLNRLRFVNYMKYSSYRTPPKLPGAKHREKTCLVCAARWLLHCVRFKYRYVYNFVRNIGLNELFAKVKKHLRNIKAVHRDLIQYFLLE